MSVMDSHVETLDDLFRNIEDGKTEPDKVEEELKEAEELLAEMKIELHAVANKAKKDDYILKMQTYQKLIAKHKKTLLTTSTSSLNGSRAPVSATQKNQDSLDTLKRAHAQLAETEEVGVGVLSNLAKQKETIKNTQDNLRDVNGNLTYSNKLLNRMGKWWRG